jgi:hypothetical protein
MGASRIHTVARVRSKSISDPFRVHLNVTVRSLHIIVHGKADDKRGDKLPVRCPCLNARRNHMVSAHATAQFPDNAVRRSELFADTPSSNRNRAAKVTEDGVSYKRTSGPPPRTAVKRRARAQLAE